MVNHYSAFKKYDKHFQFTPSKRRRFNCLVRVTSGISQFYKQLHKKTNINHLLFCRYRYISCIAKGGFSQIIHAQDTCRMNKSVAIKIMNSKYTDIGIQVNNLFFFYYLLKKESERLKLLNRQDPNDNTHIIRLYSTFFQQDNFCLVFELLGENLLQHLKVIIFFKKKY